MKTNSSPLIGTNSSSFSHGEILLCLASASRRQRLKNFKMLSKQNGYNLERSKNGNHYDISKDGLDIINTRCLPETYHLKLVRDNILILVPGEFQRVVKNPSWATSFSGVYHYRYAAAKFLKVPDFFLLSYRDTVCFYLDHYESLGFKVELYDIENYETDEENMWVDIFAERAAEKQRDAIIKSIDADVNLIRTKRKM